MQQTYLLNNTLCYSNTSSCVTWSDTINAQSNVNFIRVTDKVNYNTFAYYNEAVGQQEHTTTFNMFNRTLSSNVHTILYSVRLTFSCSNITDLTSNDSITFTVNDQQYEYPLNQMYMNFINLRGITTGSDIHITAKSSKELTLMKSKAFTNNPEHNLNILVY